MTVSVFAPAKVNLTLHITGQRPDGYHLIDSLVAFADVGDLLHLSPADTGAITVTGPEAAGVPGDVSNLALQAVGLIGTAQVTLDKRLPAASGVGGGSADAAAAFRAMLVLGGQDPEGRAAFDLGRSLLELGADVPMCLASQMARVQGIGEQIAPQPGFPPLPALLVNPRVPLATAAVFKGLGRKDNPPMPQVLPGFATVQGFAAWLAKQRNDLQPPAMAVAPVIGDVLAMLSARAGCLLARMSGSGATCFALFADEAAAAQAGREVLAARPDWWVALTELGDQGVAAAPRLS